VYCTYNGRFQLVVDALSPAFPEGTLLHMGYKEDDVSGLISPDVAY